jgi:hypothetical protein
MSRQTGRCRYKYCISIAELLNTYVFLTIRRKLSKCASGASKLASCDFTYEGFNPYFKRYINGASSLLEAVVNMGYLNLSSEKDVYY